jgi:hypothetical protein
MKHHVEFFFSFLMEEADSGGLMVWWENISSAPSRLVAKALQ